MRGSLAPKLAILISASLLAVCSHVLAQSDDILDTVLITGSLIRGVATSQTGPRPQIDLGRLTQLTDEELRTTLRGARIQALEDGLHSDSFGCDGDYAHVGFRAPVYGRYSVRNNQYCVEAMVGGNYRVCAKMFRGETGKMFLQGVSEEGKETAPPAEVRIDMPEQACRR